ncbi:MAG: MurR/RpiR family transcriptional regulator [Streptococcaceae bacterium]|jgi:DNA-binding MurR/RpiR family transcriptional regulator|nr:MurR/RpiR family transcriptional regulator [Streptococcaceae bacterium]
MKKLSNAESAVWDVITAHYAEIPQLSIGKLAELVPCSLSTINRTVKKKGFSGYSEFRNSVKEPHLQQLTGFSQDVLSAIQKNEEELLKTVGNISADTIEQAVKLIDGARDILIFSRGMSINVANEMLGKLQLTGKKVASHDDPKYMNYYGQHATPDTLVIALSLLGESQVVVASRFAKEQGAKVLVLTTVGISALAQLADVLLLGYKSRLEVNWFELDTHSRLPLYILVRVLFDAYSIYKKGKIS